MLLYILITFYFIDNAFIVGYLVGSDQNLLRPFTPRTVLALLVGMCIMLPVFLTGMILQLISKVKTANKVIKIMKKAGTILTFRQKVYMVFML